MQEHGQQQLSHWNRILISEEFVLLWAIVAILLVLWLLGLTFYMVGPLIHLLLVIAGLLLIVNLVTEQRS